MRVSSARRHRPRRSTARLMLRLDTGAQATLATLCTAIGRSPPQVLRQVVDWGLTREARWRVERQRMQRPTNTIVVRLEPDVWSRVHLAARAAGGRCLGLGVPSAAPGRRSEAAGHAAAKRG